MNLVNKIRIFFPEISILKFFTLILISVFYGISTIATIYIVSTLVSVISLSSGIELIQPISFLINLIGSLFELSPKLAHIFLGIITLGFMIVFGLIKLYLISKTCSQSRHHLSMKILEKTLRLNYDFESKSHTGNIKTLILDETAHIIQQLLRPTIEILTSLAFITILLINLFFYNSLITIYSSILFSIIYILIFISTKSLIRNHGQNRFLTNKKRYKKIDDALNLKVLSNILNTINLFLNRYSTDSKKMARHQYLFDFISASPKIIIESIVFLAILLIIIFLNNDTNVVFNKTSFAEKLIFFALTGLKILPEFQRLYVSFGLLKFGDKSQEKILKLLKDNKNNIILEKINEQEKNKTILNFYCDSCFTGDKKILNSVRLQLNLGDRLAIKGRSGSGKTTLTHAIMGAIPVMYKGERKFFKSNAKFGYLPQETSLFSSSVYENISMGREMNQDKKKYIQKVAISLFPEFQNENIDIFLNRIIDDVSTELSIGQKQRIGLLRAIYGNPQILILDEFTSALDEKNEEIIINFVDKLDSYEGLIVIGHREKSNNICKKIYNLENGNLIKVK